MSLLLEAKIEDLYNQHYSNIDRTIYDKLISADPNTGKADKVGVYAEKLILPAYVENNLDISDTNLNNIKETILKYEENRKNGMYKGATANPNSFTSLDEFISFVNSDNTDLENAPEEEEKIDPLTDIYNKYYSKLSRDVFDKLVELDPESTSTKLGEVAKNLLLRLATNKNEDIFKNYSELELLQYIEIYYENRNNYDNEHKNLNNYKSLQDFIDFITILPDTDYITLLKTCDHKDEIHILARTKNWLVVTYDSSYAGAFVAGRYKTIHATNQSNDCLVWCTTTPGSHFYADYAAEGKIIAFININYRVNSANKKKHFQVCIQHDGHIKGNRSDGVWGRFLDGADQPTPFEGSTCEEQFKSFLTVNYEIYNAIKDINEIKKFNDLFNVAGSIENTVITKFKINDKISLSEFIALPSSLKNNIRSIDISNIEIIPAAFAEGLTLLTKVNFDNNLKVIEDAAFKNCTNLKHIQFPESLVKIGRQAFANSGLIGSAKIPNSVTEIKNEAFIGTKIQLGIDINRNPNNKLNIMIKTSRDLTWYNVHLKAKKY